MRLLFVCYVLILVIMYKFVLPFLLCGILTTTTACSNNVEREPNRVYSFNELDYTLGIKTEENIITIGEVYRGSSLLLWNGVQTHFKKPKVKNEVITIDLHSSGGSVPDLGVIKETVSILKERGYVVKTLVRDMNYCASACTHIFLVGDIRVAHKNSVFMFHAPTSRMVDLKTNKIIKDVPEPAKRYFKNLNGKGTQEFIKFYSAFCGIGEITNSVKGGYDLHLNAEEISETCPNFFTELK